MDYKYFTLKALHLCSRRTLPCIFHSCPKSTAITDLPLHTLNGWRLYITPTLSAKTHTHTHTRRRESSLKCTTAGLNRTNPSNNPGHCILVLKKQGGLCFQRRPLISLEEKKKPLSVFKLFSTAFTVTKVFLCKSIHEGEPRCFL